MQIFEQLEAWFAEAGRILSTPLLRIGATDLPASALIQFAVLLALLLYGARRFKGLMLKRLLPRSKLDIGAQQAVAAVSYYLFLLFGLIIVLQTVGVDLTTLNVLAGAVGIGIGFGLQSVSSNFISGLIILFERPIKLGDRIEIGDVSGDVIEIGARSTTVLTNDNIAILVPNSRFITENVINWKYNDPRLRFRVPVSVAYGSDVHVVEQLLLKVARENADVLETPPPSVQFVSFGDNGLEFTLLVWTDKLVHRRGVLVSRLNFAIYDTFKEYGIEIPFPQRDLHIRSVDADRSVIRGAAASSTESAAGQAPPG